VPRAISTRNLAAMLLAVLCLGVLAGCAATRDNKRASDLPISIRLYLQALRWGDYTTAIAMLRRPDGSLPAADVERLEGLRVTTFDYQIVGGAPGDLEAMMTATLDYYWEDQGNVHKVGQRATWWWDEDLQRWFLDDMLPDFKR